MKAKASYVVTRIVYFTNVSLFFGTNGILKEMGDEMAKGFAEAKTAEDPAIRLDSSARRFRSPEPAPL